LEGIGGGDDFRFHAEDFAGFDKVLDSAISASAAADENGLEGAAFGWDIGSEKGRGGEGGSGEGGVANETTSGQWIVHGMRIKTEESGDF
jgi:hypothetical protein